MLLERISMIACLLLLLNVVCISSHPQCLDFKPPFTPEANLTFCAQYSKFGCCTTDQDTNIRRQYERLRAQIPASLWLSCGNYAKELLCQRCSPYAAHIYDTEARPLAQPRSFPGLCNSYCRSFYQNCSEIIKYMSAEKNLHAAVSKGVASFCNYIALPDVDYCYPELLTKDILNDRISVQQVNSEGCLCLEKFADKLRNPVFARHSNDGTQRIFIGEQLGVIHIYYPNGTKKIEPFLDVQPKIYTTKSKGDERGFFSIAFHPNFKNNGKFYAYYSTGSSVNTIENNYHGQIEIDHKIRISEFKVLSSNKDKADPLSEKPLIEVEEPFWNHNGGELLFGIDGYLYIFIGDGGNAGDPYGFSQDMSTKLGKVLRIDVDGSHPKKPYGIPPDNPFLNIHEEVYAYGVRNIWRCGMDRGDPNNAGEGRGRIFCGDVGQSKYEEIDVLKKGANYGWNAFEGNSCFKHDLCTEIANVEHPLFVYNHTVGKSITGGHFYRGCSNPNLNGFYIYGDFMNGRLFRLLENKQTGKWENKEINMCESDMCVPPIVNTYPPNIISFGEDEDGEIYMLTTSFPSTAHDGGAVYRFIDPARRGNPANCKSARNPGTSYTSSPIIESPSPSTKTPDLGISHQNFIPVRPETLSSSQSIHLWNGFPFFKVIIQLFRI
ncbi:hypothetical protein CHS0354_036013 [Potamilus streckersoni]|uniref:HHIP-like protein 2 n=1 Tax=Potamilus streckersoni TaxID=2493646 RepID=A0AAE0RMI3_9BIVA|nr:hypothetical protein CHS0354_036013 [Potamilus streckersoni]